MGPFGLDHGQSLKKGRKKKKGEKKKNGLGGDLFCCNFLMAQTPFQWIFLFLGEPHKLVQGGISLI